MTGLKNLILVIIITGAGISANAETARTLSLDECVSIALEHNLSLRQEKTALQSAKFAAKNVWSQLLPGLSLGTGANYSTSLADGSAQEDDGSIEYSISAALSIQLDGSTAAEIKAARLSGGLAELSYEAACREIIASVSDSFLSLQLEQSKYQLLEESLKLAEKQYEKSRTRYENGYADRKEVLQARLEAENARLELSRGQASLNLQKLELKNLLGLPSETEILLAGSLDAVPAVFDEEELISRYLSESNSIQTAELQLELARTSASITSAARFPSVQLSGAFKTSGNGDTDPASAFSASLSVSIPLDGWIPGSQTDLKIREAAGKVEIAGQELALVRASAEYEILVLASTLAEKENEIEIARLRLSLAEETWELSEKEYTNGTIELLELQESGKDLLSARLDLLNSRYEYLAALGDLKQKLGSETYKELISQEKPDEQ